MSFVNSAAGPRHPGRRLFFVVWIRENI